MIPKLIQVTETLEQPVLQPEKLRQILHANRESRGDHVDILKGLMNLLKEIKTYQRKHESGREVPTSTGPTRQYEGSNVHFICLVHFIGSFSKCDIFNLTL
mgnify:CR=1 FL=1